MCYFLGDGDVPESRDHCPQRLCPLVAVGLLACRTFCRVRCHKQRGRLPSAAPGSCVIWLTGVFHGSWVFGTNMRSELFVALEFIMHLHLVNGFSNERP